MIRGVYADWELVEHERPFSLEPPVIWEELTNWDLAPLRPAVGPAEGEWTEVPRNFPPLPPLGYSYAEVVRLEEPEEPVHDGPTCAWCRRHQKAVTRYKRMPFCSEKHRELYILNDGKRTGQVWNTA